MSSEDNLAPSSTLSSDAVAINVASAEPQQQDNEYDNDNNADEYDADDHDTLNEDEQQDQQQLQRNNNNSSNQVVASAPSSASASLELFAIPGTRPNRPSIGIKNISSVLAATTPPMTSPSPSSPSASSSTTLTGTDAARHRKSSTQSTDSSADTPRSTRNRAPFFLTTVDRTTPFQLAADHHPAALHHLCCSPRLMKLFIKFYAYTYPLWVASWWLGVALTTLILLQVVEAKYAPLALAGLVVIVRSLLLASSQLMRLLFARFEFWWLIAQIILQCISFCYMVDGDVRVCFVVFFFFSNLVVVCYDAVLPRWSHSWEKSNRKRGVILFFFMLPVVCGALSQIALAFGVAARFIHVDFAVSYNFWLLSTTHAEMVLWRSITLFLFYSAHILSMIHQQSFVIIRSRMGLARQRRINTHSILATQQQQQQQQQHAGHRTTGLIAPSPGQTSEQFSPQGVELMPPLSEDRGQN